MTAAPPKELYRATVEAVLEVSAQSVAGDKHQGRAGGEISWYGKQNTTVRLSGRRLRVKTPRLGRKGQGPGGEVAVPALAAMRAKPQTGSRILEIVMRGVSTRNYSQASPQGEAPHRCSP
ncbi:MAG: hypothetical protein ACE5JX_01645 [Acidobacteriota bacterium]